MARYTGPKNRLSRREGIDLGLKTIGSKSHAQLLKRQAIPPGVHGAKGRRKVSDYGIQLREKQKVKRLYGVLERQFRKVFERAKKWKGNTTEKLLEFMERRLDNVVYRSGFAPTRTMARQMVSHGHVFLDGKRVTIPSYVVNVNQVLTLSTKSMAIPWIKTLLDDSSMITPEWIERKAAAIRISRLPVRTDIKEDIQEQLIVEYYSR